ncbi:MAG: FHA domain-containing protein, partial [Defluviitaleaceae bacterium]|nr:FHA domain-containing protein [Defluviitaleaceae bacterium]
MQLILFSKQEYNSMVLPEKHAGLFLVRGRDAKGKMKDIVAVEAVRPTESGGIPQWVLKSNRKFKIYDDKNNLLQNVALNPNELYAIRGANKSESQYALYVEPLSDDRKHFTAYEVTRSSSKFSIGRNSDNDICYANKFTSDIQAELTISKDGISIRHIGTTNMTYVNGEAVRLSNEQLYIGDVVYIMGLQIVVTHGLLFINNPDEKVKVKGDLRIYSPAKMDNASVDPDSEYDFEDVADDYFYRAPRFKYGVDTFELKLDAPPTNQNNDEVPLIMLIGPSMTMGMAAAASGVFAVMRAIETNNFQQAMPSIIMSVSMLLGTLMWPLITKTFQKRLRERKEARRQESYTKYLYDMEELVKSEVTRQERILRENDVNTEA